VLSAGDGGCGATLALVGGLFHERRFPRSRAKQRPKVRPRFILFFLSLPLARAHTSHWRRSQQPSALLLLPHPLSTQVGACIVNEDHKVVGVGERSAILRPAPCSFTAVRPSPACMKARIRRPPLFVARPCPPVGRKRKEKEAGSGDGEGRLRFWRQNKTTHAATDPPHARLQQGSQPAGHGTRCCIGCTFAILLHSSPLSICSSHPSPHLRTARPTHPFPRVQRHAAGLRRQRAAVGAHRPLADGR